MFDDFDAREIDVGSTTIFARSAGSGPAALLLHGFPQTHVMWHAVAPLLARRFTVVCADLRGYGRSGCPTSSKDHSEYSKRALAGDMVQAMERLGFSRFAVAGHDRGGRVAFRMAQDAAEWRQREDGAALARGLTIDRVPVHGANDLARVFELLAQRGAHAVVVPNTSLLNPLAAQIASLAVKHRLPAIGSPIFGRAGGLLAYGPDGADMYRRAAGYVDKILKGTNPGDLPMQGPAKFELIANMKTARAIGLTIPSGLLMRADQVIE
jgi:pimeloyl-ACP methyl ester carboxylesterase